MTTPITATQDQDHPFLLSDDSDDDMPLKPKTPKTDAKSARSASKEPKTARAASKKPKTARSASKEPKTDANMDMEKPIELNSDSEPDKMIEIVQMQIEIDGKKRCAETLDQSKPSTPNKRGRHEDPATAKSHPPSKSKATNRRTTASKNSVPPPVTAALQLFTESMCAYFKASDVDPAKVAALKGENTRLIVENKKLRTQLTALKSAFNKICCDPKEATPEATQATPEATPDSEEEATDSYEEPEAEAD